MIHETEGGREEGGGASAGPWQTRRKQSCVMERCKYIHK